MTGIADYIGSLLGGSSPSIAGAPGAPISTGAAPQLPYDLQLEQIKRQQALAQGLQQQAEQAIPVASYKGIEAPIPWTAVLAKALEGADAGLAERAADKRLQALGTQGNSDMAQMLATAMGGTPSGPGGATPAPAPPPAGPMAAAPPVSPAGPTMPPPGGPMASAVAPPPAAATGPVAAATPPLGAGAPPPGAGPAAPMPPGAGAPSPAMPMAPPPAGPGAAAPGAPPPGGASADAGLPPVMAPEVVKLMSMQSLSPQAQAVRAMLVPQLQARFEAQRFLSTIDPSKYPAYAVDQAKSLIAAGGKAEDAAKVLAAAAKPTAVGGALIQNTGEGIKTLYDAKDTPIKNYEFAQSQGFKGSFLDYLHTAAQQTHVTVNTEHSPINGILQKVANGQQLSDGENQALAVMGKVGPMRDGQFAPGVTGDSVPHPETPGYATKPIATAGGLTQAELDREATDYAINHKFAPGMGIGSGGTVALKKTAIANRAAELDPNGNFASNAATAKALTGSLVDLQKQRDSIDTNVKNADAMGQQLFQRFQGKVNPSVPIINSIIGGAQYNLSPKEISAYRAGLTEVANTYQQVFARGGKVTDQVRAKAHDIADGKLGLDDLKGVFDEIQQQGQIYVGGYDKQIQDKQNAFRGIVSGRAAPQGGGAPQPGGQPQPAAQPNSAPPVSMLKEGLHTKFKNGQTWTLQGGQAVRVN